MRKTITITTCNWCRKNSKDKPNMGFFRLELPRPFKQLLGRIKNVDQVDLCRTCLNSLRAKLKVD